MNKRLIFSLLGVLSVLIALLWTLLPRTSRDTEESGAQAGANQSAANKKARFGSSFHQFSSSNPTETKVLIPIEGQVKDADSDDPIPEVNLTFRAGSAVAEATTDGQGTFRLRLTAGRYNVTLDGSSDFVPRVIRNIHLVKSKSIRWLNFTLFRYASLSGRVLSAASDPISGAMVKVQLQAVQTPAKPLPHAKTDLQGRFTLKVSPGEVVLRADADSFGSALSSRIYVRSGAHLDGLVILMGQGVTLSGRVVSPSEKKPEKAVVFIRDELGSRRLPCDAQGYFAATNLPKGDKLLQAKAKGFSPSPVKKISLHAGKPVRITLHLGESKKIGGQVVDQEGRPLSNILVTLRPGSSRVSPVFLAPIQEMRTGASGKFSFSDVPDTPLAVAAGEASQPLATRFGVAPGTMDIVLRCQALGEIIGRVTDGTTGKPLREFKVLVEEAEGAGAALRNRPESRMFSEDGTYELNEIPTGTYALGFSALGYGPASVKNIAVMPGYSARADVILYQGGSIEGVVADSRGAPIPGAQITLDTGWADAPVFSDAEGKFYIQNVGRGLRSLTARHPGYDTQIISGLSIQPNKVTQTRILLAPRKGTSSRFRFCGIGAVLSKRQNAIIVEKTIPGSPAQVAGIRRGDLILSIDGKYKSSMTFEEAIEGIRGIVGTPVRLSLKRGGKTFEINVIRNDVVVPEKG